MYAYIKGILVESSPDVVCLETHGIGYHIFIPLNAFSKLPQMGQELLLYTCLIIREQSHTLYGFIDRMDRDLYLQLLNVSGIGPKLALALVGHLPGPSLSQAISSGDITILTRVPGIGKRTAERLLVELKDKIPDYLTSEENSIKDSSQHNLKSQLLKDAINALINLGYTQSIAQKAVRQTIEDLGQSMDLPTLITSSLSRV